MRIYPFHNGTWSGQEDTWSGQARPLLYYGQRYRLWSRRFCYAIFTAMCFIVLLSPSAFACGGLYSSQSPVDQNAERIIFAVAPHAVTMYEQINYTGTASDFAWVLPIPSVPTIATAPTALFRTLDQGTAPTFSRDDLPPCGWQQPTNQHYAGAPNPNGGAPVTVYNTGSVGPYSYDIVRANDANALVTWLQSHQYHVPGTLQQHVQPYIQSHMLFMAMRLKPQQGTQDITPVKLTFTTSSTNSEVMIPIQMAADAAAAHMGMLIWIFGSSRYIPQNYASIQLHDQQFTNVSADASFADVYQSQVDRSVQQAGGHAFITDYAGPTNNLYIPSYSSVSLTELRNLKQQYSYVTRLYTRISPDQMNIDPMFAAQTGLPDVRTSYTLTPANTCDPFNSWPGQVSTNLGPLVYPLECSGCLIVLAAIIVPVVIVFTRRRRGQRQNTTKT